MDPRIESITRDGSELLVDYLASVMSSSAKFVETLVGNVGTLVKGVVEEGLEVVSAATSPFVPENVADESTEEPATDEADEV